MAEYIEREAAIDAIMKVYVRTAGYKARERVFEAEEAVHRLPVADVVPVVRCRDCKYYRASSILAPNEFCFRLKHPVEDRHIGYNFAPDDFCSHGERKDGGDGAKAD